MRRRSKPPQRVSAAGGAGAGSPRSTCRAPSPSDSACRDKKSSPSGARGAGGWGRGWVAGVAVEAGGGRGALPLARKRESATLGSSSGWTISPSSISESAGGNRGGGRTAPPAVTTSTETLPSRQGSASVPTTKTRRRVAPSARVESAWGGVPGAGVGCGGCGSGWGLSSPGKSWLRLLSS